MTNGVEPLGLADFNLKATLSSLGHCLRPNPGFGVTTLHPRKLTENKGKRTIKGREVLLTVAALNLNPRPDATQRALMTSTNFPVTAGDNTYLTKQEAGVRKAGVTVTCLRDKGLSTESPELQIFLPARGISEGMHPLCS